MLVLLRKGLSPINISVGLLLSLVLSTASPVIKRSESPPDGSKYHCSLLRTAGKIPPILNAQRWEDDLECYTWHLNQMLLRNNICFYFLFERKLLPMGYSTQGTLKRRQTVLPFAGIGTYDMIYTDYKDCYIANIYFAPIKHHLKSFDAEFHENILAHADYFEDIHINSQVNWYFHGNGGWLPPPKLRDISLTVYHEILHTIGVRHDETNEDALMYPTATRATKNITSYKFTNKERQQLLSMYGRLSDALCPLKNGEPDERKLPFCRGIELA